MPNLVNSFPEVLTNCRFYIELKLEGSQDPVDAYFMDCRGFKQTQAVIEVCEVTPQRWGSAKSGQLVRTKIPGSVKTNNLTLRRGLTQSTAISKWFEAVQAGKWEKQRRDGSLSIYNQGGNVQARFTFLRAWPTSYLISDLSASSNDLEIEEMELAFEELIRNQ